MAPVVESPALSRMDEPQVPSQVAVIRDSVAGGLIHGEEKANLLEWLRCPFARAA
jgi:hypothetical protein